MIRRSWCPWPDLSSMLGVQKPGSTGNRGRLFLLQIWESKVETSNVMFSGECEMSWLKQFGHCLVVFSHSVRIGLECFAAHVCTTFWPLPFFIRWCAVYLDSSMNHSSLWIFLKTMATMVPSTRKMSGQSKGSQHEVCKLPEGSAGIHGNPLSYKIEKKIGLQEISFPTRTSKINIWVVFFCHSQSFQMKKAGDSTGQTSVSEFWTRLWFFSCKLHTMEWQKVALSCEDLLNRVHTDLHLLFGVANGHFGSAIHKWMALKHCHQFWQRNLMLLSFPPSLINVLVLEDSLCSRPEITYDIHYLVLTVFIGKK